ncbi:MAG: anthranilate phosphoribosyltransferase [Nitrospinota bacterium]|nr:MAG: anthranilate phosphoribosyltransferase [Nitrospinota bacterium]
MNAFIPFLQAVGRGEKLKRDLTVDEAREAMRLLLSGQATPAQIGAFLIAQRVKGESADEVVGFTEAARTFCQQLSLSVPGLIDLGLPYDGKTRTLQLAPIAALVAAAAGQPVVLHGNRRIPTKCGLGPADLLEALGIPVDLPPAVVARQVAELGIGFLYVPRFCPAWHALTPLRHQLGLRTVLNTVEKLWNPSRAPILVAGFFHKGYLQRMRQAMGRLVTQGWIVQGAEGSIESVPGRVTHLLPADPQAEPLVVDPQALGLGEEGSMEAPPQPGVQAAVARQVLDNQPGPARDTVILTAGVLLFLGRRVSSLEEGVSLARAVLDSGTARQWLARWQTLT